MLGSGSDDITRTQNSNVNPRAAAVRQIWSSGIDVA